jgi:hypothetical protein
MPGHFIRGGPLVLRATRVLTTAGASFAMTNEPAVVVNKPPPPLLLPLLFSQLASTATAITLPPNPDHGTLVTVMDGKGDAAANPITVSAPAGALISGGASHVISIGYGACSFLYDGISSPPQWLALDAGD